MNTNKFVATLYGRNIAGITDFTAYMSHAQSLLAPHPRANCAHWLVGHLCVYRNRLLRLVGQPAAIDDAAVARYMRGSAPVHSDEPGLTPFATLRTALLDSQVPLAAALDALNDVAGAIPVSFDTTSGLLTATTAEWFLFLLRHEALHTGQLDLCAELVK